MEHRDGLEPWLRRNGVGETFRALATLVPAGAVVVTDPARRVLFWSPEAERLFGHPAADVLGRPCPDGIVCDATEHGAGDPRPQAAAVRVPGPDGRPVQIRHYATHLPGEHGGAIHLLVRDPGQRADVAPLRTAEAIEFHGLVTRDPAMIHVLDVVRNVAETEATVLVRGESGTGKELVARAIHLEGRRRGGPFVAVNCASFSPALLESELFGHVKGAFTGAVAARKGIFAQADGGTLFLDEVAELPLDLQAKLLRVLQERVVVPVGGADPIEVDVRVIAATHKALREEARHGRFREDLMFRLRVVPLFLPPLRQRPADVELLLRRFVDVFNGRGPRFVEGFSPEALRALSDWPWPGNVRELRNVVEYVFAVGRGPVVGLHELPPELRERDEPTAPHHAPTAPHHAPTAHEHDRVAAAIKAADGDLEAAAATLGVSRTTFWRMRRRAGL